MEGGEGGEREGRERARGGREREGSGARPLGGVATLERDASVFNTFARPLGRRVTGASAPHLASVGVMQGRLPHLGEAWGHWHSGRRRIRACRAPAARSRKRPRLRRVGAVPPPHLPRHTLRVFILLPPAGRCGRSREVGAAGPGRWRRRRLPSLEGDERGKRMGRARERSSGLWDAEPAGTLERAQARWTGS